MTDGTWERIAKQILGLADNLGLVDLAVGSADGMFVPGKGAATMSLMASSPHSRRF